MTAVAGAPKQLSPECSIGECGFCPGDGIPVFAPGKRAPGEPPLFVYRCDHGCRHGLSACNGRIQHHSPEGISP